MSKKIATVALVASAVATAASMGATEVRAADQEKCYGVALAGTCTHNRVRFAPAR